MNTNPASERIYLSYSQLILVALAHIVALVAAVGLSKFFQTPIASSYAAWLALGWMLVGKKLMTSFELKQGWDIVGAFRLVAYVTCWPFILAN